MNLNIFATNCISESEKSRIFESAISGVALISDLLGIPFAGAVVSTRLLIQDLTKVYAGKKFERTGFLLDINNMSFSNSGNSKFYACLNCGFINHSYSKYCNNCGSPLEHIR